LARECEPPLAFVARGGGADEVEDGDRPPQLDCDGDCKPVEILQLGRARAVAGEAAAHGGKLDLDLVEEIAWQRHSVAGRGPLPWHIR
jgi:hypothetical protein